MKKVEDKILLPRFFKTLPFGKGRDELLIRADHNNPRQPANRRGSMLLFLIFLSFTSAAFSQQNTKLEITGAKHFSAGDYRNWIGFNENLSIKSFSADSIKAKIYEAL